MGATWKLVLFYPPVLPKFRIIILFQGETSG
jgi:hypothetical protein